MTHFTAHNTYASFFERTVIYMKLSSIAKGVAVGMTAGAVAYTVANSSAKEKRKLKSNTARAIKAIGDVMDDLGSMMQ